MRAFRQLQDAGRLEVITSTATHAFFPLLDRNWAALRAQVHMAADLYEHHFGRRPRGMWLGECGYVPGCDELLREAAIRYFIVDTHALLLRATDRPVYGVYAPVYCPTGVAAFGRDTESSQQVWSAKEGYPGDPHYRDFYRDIGFDLPIDYIGPYVHPEGIRMYTGIKYHAITHDKLHDKWVYDPDVARGRVGPARLALPRQPGEAGRGAGRPAWTGRRSSSAPYDAELYGHWWYEGPLFLNDLFRQLPFDQDVVETITPGDYLELSAFGVRESGDYRVRRGFYQPERNRYTYFGKGVVSYHRRHGSVFFAYSDAAGSGDNSGYQFCGFHHAFFKRCPDLVFFIYDNRGDPVTLPSCFFRSLPQK